MVWVGTGLPAHPHSHGRSPPTPLRETLTQRRSESLARDGNSDRIALLASDRPYDLIGFEAVMLVGSPEQLPPTGQSSSP
jgi:hypothetical protein